MDPFSHEVPMLLVLPAAERVEAVVPRLLSDPALRHHALPALWALDASGVDLPSALPGCAAVTLDTLEDVLGTLIRLCDAAALDALVQRSWQEVDERVRQHYLEMGVGRAFASLFKLGTPTIEREPPPSFRRERIHEHGFELHYRLAAQGPTSVRAPAHEGSLVVYPFDPAGSATREEAGIGPGSGAVLEIFAYETGRAQHRAHWEGVAAAAGWQFVDALADGPAQGPESP